MVEEKQVSQMLGQELEMQLGDGKVYKLGQFGILDLMYFEEKFGSLDILFNNKKPFTVIVHILYCILKKNYPDLKLEDLDKLVPFDFLNRHPEIIEFVTQQIAGTTKPTEEGGLKNSPKPETTQ